MAFTVTVLLSAVMIASLIWFYPIIESEAGVRVPTQIITMIPSQFPLDIDGDGIPNQFDISSETAIIGGGGIHVFDVVDNNKVNFEFSQGTSRSGKSSFNHYGTAVMGTSFLAPHTGTYEITFLDRAEIDVTKTFAQINFIPPPRCFTTCYVTSFAKFSYDVRAENYNDGTENYWTSGNSDTKDMNIFISSPTITAAGLGQALPPETFASRNKAQADIITVAGTAVSNFVVGAVSALVCNVCAAAVVAVTSSFISDEIEGLLNEDSNLFGAITGSGGSGIISRETFGGEFPSATTFEVELDKDELVFVSSRIIVVIDQVDDSSRHRHGAGIAGNYELQQISIKVFESTPPVITLEGDDPFVLEVGDTYVEPGATVEDNVAGYDEVVEIDSSGVDSNTIGSYIVTYNAPADAQGNVPLQVTRTVNVVDTTSPEITLDGIVPGEVLVGTSYVEEGASVTDNSGEDLSAALDIDSSAVDASTVGTYLVTYDVADSSGNAAIQVTRTVNVLSLVITADLNSDLSLSPGDQVIIEGGTVSGNVNVDGGILTIREGATIFGNIEATNGAIISIENSSVFGNVVMKDSECITITGSTITGNVEMENGECVIITGSTINGSVMTKNVQEVTITDNPVIGAIDSENDVKVFIENNNAHLIAS